MLNCSGKWKEDAKTELKRTDFKSVYNPHISDINAIEKLSNMDLRRLLLCLSADVVYCL